MLHVRPNEQRAKNAIILIWIVMALDLLSFYSGYLQLTLINDVEQGAYITEATIAANDTREVVIAVLYFVVFFISGIVYLHWFQRAYYNLHVMIDNPRFSENWATWSWFVPVLGLYRPFQIMRELFRETKALLMQHNIPLEQPTPAYLLPVWWSFWITSNLIGQVLLRTADNVDTIESLRFATNVGMVNSLIGIPLAFLAVRVIQHYSTMETYLPAIQQAVQAKQEDTSPLLP